jgi:hypothetical protein
MAINIKIMISWVVTSGMNMLEYSMPSKYWSHKTLLLELLHYDIREKLYGKHNWDRL